MEIVGINQLQDKAQAQVVPVVRRTGIAVWKKLSAIAALVFVVWQFYYFRELAAALLIFTILFLMFAAIVGVIYLVGRATQKGFSIAEPAARRGLILAGEVSRKTFHRPRSVPVP